MVRLISIIYVVLLSWWQTEEANGNPIAIAAEAIAIGYQIYLAAKAFRDLITNESPIDVEENEAAAWLTGLEKIENHISTLHLELNDLSNQLELKEISTKMDDIRKVVEYVNRTYNTLVTKIQVENCLGESELDKLFVDAILGNKLHDLDSMIPEMHSNFITPGGAEEDSLLTLISGDKTHLLMCNREQSNHQTIFQIYKSIVNTDLKALALRLAAWEIIAKKDKMDGKTKKRYEKDEYDQFVKRINDLSDAVFSRLREASRAMWRCDSKNFIEGKSYSKLQQIFQAVVLNEEDTTEDSCRYGGCSKMPKLKYQPNGDAARKLPCKLHCDGYVTDCVDTSTDNIDYCEASESDDRRYAGLKYSGKTYGSKFDENSCRRHYGTVKGRTVWFHYCGFCLCTCVSTKIEVDRYFSLKEVETNTESQMVITGVHLRLINHIFYIDIREGRLGENGTIVPGSTTWTNASSEDKVDFETTIAESSGEFEVLPKNDNVYAVHWEQKTVYLDDIEDNSGHFVLTGLRFVQHEDAVKLAVRLHSFDYKTGRIYSKYKWSHNSQTTKSRGVVDIKDGDYPIKKADSGKTIKNNAMSRTGTYLQFTTTSREKNLGQFTIPFVDTQEVAPEPPTPLSGVGLYHKGMAMRESGGFLGLKVFQLPFTQQKN